MMFVLKMIPSGLDACWGADDFKRIEQYAKEGGAAGRSKAVSLTGLVGFKAIGNFTRHTATAGLQLPVAVLVELGRLVGVNAAKSSSYDLKRVALHVLRAFQQAMLALGSLVGFCTFVPFVKPLFAASLYHGLRLDRSLENGAAEQAWRARLEGYCAQAQSQAKKVWQSTRNFVALVVSNKDPKLTMRVVGGLVASVVVLAAAAKGLSSPGLIPGPSLINGDSPPSGLNPFLGLSLCALSLLMLGLYSRKGPSNIGQKALMGLK